MDPTGVEILESLVGIGQPVFHRGQLDQAAIGQGHQFDELGPGSDQIADDVLFRDDHVDGGDPDVLAIAHDIIAAGRSGHGKTLGRGALLADEVDYRFGAGATGECEHGLHFVAVGLHQLVGSDLARQRQGGFGLVDHDDVGGTHGLEALDADMAEAAGADHHAALARQQVARRLLGGAIGGQARIGIGSDFLGSEGLGKRHDIALGGAQELRIAAVAVEPRKAARAVHVHAATAGQAGAARDLGMDDDGIPDLDALDLLADRFDPAGIFMPHDQRQQLIAVGIHMRAPDALDDVEIGAAYARSADPHDDVVRLFDPGIGNLLKIDPLAGLQIVVIAGEHLRLHCHFLRERGLVRASTERQQSLCQNEYMRFFKSLFEFHRGGCVSKLNSCAGGVSNRRTVLPGNDVAGWAVEIEE